MEKFIVSARKYRPQNFESLVGQESIARTLKNSIKRGQLAHAYLFCGPRGVGKTSTARIFAKTINCLNPSADMEPCGVCESCRSFAEGRSYCIHELDAASNNSVDDIRLLNEQVRIPPQVGKYSVYIIDEVHMLSSAAFNAFLKTLEEPPSYVIFILATTEKQKILPTVLSRCQTFDFNRISVRDIVANLSGIAKEESINIDEDSLHVIADKADGAMRDALTLFDQVVAFCGRDVKYPDVIKDLNVLDYEYYFRLVDCFLKGDYASPLLILDEILSKGFNALYFISGLGTHLRNLLVSKSASASSLMDFAPSLVARYKEQSSRCQVPFLYDCLNEAVRCENDYKSSSSQRLRVEFMLVKLSRLSSPAPAILDAVKEEAPEKPLRSAARNISSGREMSSRDVSAAASVEKPDSSVDKGPSEKKPHSETKATNVKIPNSHSIKGIMRKMKEEENKIKSGEELQDTEITPEDLDLAWKRLTESFSAQPRLCAAIKMSKPELLEDGHTVNFYVRNVAQQSWIEKKSLFKITSFLQKDLKNGALRVFVKVKEDDEKSEKKLYLPQEKAEYLLKKYPEAEELKKDLKLELK